MNLGNAMIDHVNSLVTKNYFVFPNEQLWYGYMLFGDMDR